MDNRIPGVQLHQLPPAPTTLPRTQIVPDGYPKLANLMGNYTEMAIFRRFSDLNYLNALSLQAEIQELQVHLGDICYEDNTSSDPERVTYTKYYHALRKSAGGCNGDQYEMLMKIRTKLDEYNRALLQINELNKLKRPHRSSLDLFRTWLCGKRQGNCFLMGGEVTTWDDASDLLTFYQPNGEQDPFSRWLYTTLLPLYHKMCGPSRRKKRKAADLESGMTEYSESSLIRLGNIIATTISSVLPLLAILVLYLVQSTSRRIYLMMAFTTTFAASLATFTSARRIEIFAATATFAAVEVVFIGNI